MHSPVPLGVLARLKEAAQAWFAINAWMIPVYLTIAMVMLVRMLGLAALSGILVLVCSLFLNGRMMIRLR